MESIPLNIAVSVVTAFVTYLVIEYLKKSGRITVNLTSSNIVLSKPNKLGGQEPTVFLHEAEDLNISLGIDIYNSSQVAKSLREVGLEIKHPKRRKFFSSASVLLKEKQQQDRYRLAPYQKLGIINLPPRELIHLEIKSWVRVADHDLKGELTFNLVAKYPNGWRFKKYLVLANPEAPFVRTE
jgi:hypothetical protein